MTPLQSFIAQALTVHGDTYRYLSLDGKKATIECKVHGIFLQGKSNHLQGKGCISCGRLRTSQAKQVTYREFLTRARNLHGNLYGYSHLRKSWAGIQGKLPIKCPVHGFFYQKLANHLQGKGCKRCACSETNAKLRRSTSSILKQILKIYPGYTFPNPHNRRNDPLDFVCPIHGKGTSSSLGILYTGTRICKGCSGEHKRSLNAIPLKEFIERSKKVHFDFDYDYSKVVYVNAHTYVTVVCKHHGPFEVRPWAHLRSATGCNQCIYRGRARPVTLKGKTFILDSNAEKDALKWIFRNTSIEPDEIFEFASKRVPKISGDFLGAKSYHPDFYVPSWNLLVEVKSLASAGMKGKYFTKSWLLFARLQAKAKASKKAGYTFKLLVMDSKGHRVDLPTRWRSMSHKSVVRFFS